MSTCSARARPSRKKAIAPFATILGIGLLLATGSTTAFEFTVGSVEGSLNSKLTVGAGWRVEPRDAGLVGKLNVPGQQSVCKPDDCMSLSNNPAPNQRLLDARGGFAMHEADDGNLNYDKGDLFSALVKLNSSATVHWKDFTAKVSGVAFYDAINHDFRETHENTDYQPRRTRRSENIDDQVGLRAEFREAFVQYEFEIGEQALTFAVGAQRVRWGEANFTVLNTLDVINPQNAILPRQPGFALNELNDPTNVALLDAELVDGVSLEAFYQYDWEAARPEPAGTYFSSADVIGGRYIQAAPGQFAEDPDGQYQSRIPVSLLTSASRSVRLTEGRARNGGQFGARLSWYLENLNDGTELGFYYAKYHSRLPYLSVYEAQQSCMRRATIPGSFVAATIACSNATGIFNGVLQAAPSLATEPAPADTERAILAYPENLHMLGLSFNTTAFGWSVSGEYSYRPNLPAQILFSDVLFAGVQQAFPAQDTAIPSQLLPGLAIVTIPGARTIVPDYISTYRGRTMQNGNEFQPGEFIRGWERLEVGQLVVNGLKLLPSYFGSTDITVAVEGGFTHVIDMPRGIYFQGQVEGTHPGPGADGTGPAPQTTLRLNPTQQTDGFATSFSWGVRGLIQLNYTNVLVSGLTIKPTMLLFKDIGGIAPFPAQNYVEGNTWITGGAQFQIGQNIEGTLLYMYFDGSKNALQDRDNVQVSLSYAF
jgi:hypothetical protein